jgi:hypothetical protein
LDSDMISTDAAQALASISHDRGSADDSVGCSWIARGSLVGAVFPLRAAEGGADRLTRWLIASLDGYKPRYEAVARSKRLPPP